MSESRDQVLRMLQDGTISAEQAAELLEALGAEEESHSIEPAAAPSVEYHTTTAIPPELARFRRYWQIPFFGALALLILTGLWLRSLYRSSDGSVTIGFGCVLGLFMLSSFLTLLALLSRNAPWAHVRVQDADGSRVAFSLPLPLGLARWALQVARGYVDADTQVHLDTAAEFLDAAQENMRDPNAEPLTISVDDEDGDKVQIYIG